jgi:hypothetical protein
MVTSDEPLPEVTQPSRAWRAVLVDAALAALAAGIVFASAWIGARDGVAFLKMGPNTGFYLSGVAPLYEIEGLRATRWTTYHATLALPLRVRGGRADVSYGFARVLPQTAVVEVSLADRLIDRFTCRGGVFRVRSARAGLDGSVPAVLRFDVDSHDRKDLGLKLDWVRIAAADHGRLALRGVPLLVAPLFLAAFFACLRLIGQGRAMSALLALPLALAAGVWAQLEPYEFAHVVSRTGLVAIGLTVLLTLGLRRVKGGAALMPLVVLAYVLKAGGLFYPTSSYPDYQHAQRYAHRVAAGEGSLAERGREAQRHIGVAYPRVIAGKKYAFPYSPFGYLPFAVFQDADALEDAFRQASLLTATLELLLVFGLARLLLQGTQGASRVPFIATLLAALLPSTFSRLLLAMGTTLFGHFWDVTLIIAALLYLRRPQGRTLALVGLATLASLLLYVSSLFTVSAFLVLLAALERRHALRLLLILSGATAITVTWLYAPFVREFFGEIVPAVLGGARMARAPGVPTGPWAALDRIPMFFGWALPALSVAGYLLWRRRIDAAALSVVRAYGLAFLLLFALRAFGGGLFRDLKETTFVGPLVAILSAVTIDSLAGRDRWGRWAAALVLVGLAVFSAERSMDYLVRYWSPFTHAIESDQALPEAAAQAHSERR